MKYLDIVIFFSYFIFILPFFTKPNESTSTSVDNDSIYIVYMGAAHPSLTTANHAQLLTSLVKRKPNSLVYNYKHGISGFAARLSKDEAQLLAQKPGVVSVFRDPILEPHTTRSWDFLNYQAGIQTESTNPNSNFTGSDTIIGIIDSGIWPESESFNDRDMTPIPPRWKGTCIEGSDFKSSNCNRKLIGARFYNDPDLGNNRTARDITGHGTHVASTAAGRVVQSTSYYGLASGTARGGSPGSRIAVYQVCSRYICRGSSILAAFDDAIADGVDIINLSIGSSARPAYSDDPIAIGALHAVAKGITVVCSAGNEGPSAGTVANNAPWILTVTATTIDRDFTSNVVLGDKSVIKGEGIHFASIQNSPVYPLIYGLSAKKPNVYDYDASNCHPDSLNKSLIAGRIVLCDYAENEDGDYSEEDRKTVIQSLKGIGVILVDKESRSVAATYGGFPMTVIGSKDAAKILNYMNTTRSPVATIMSTKEASNYKPAPAVAYFSSRGPSSTQRNILKPDIAAPGVDILAAWIGNDTTEMLKGKKPPLFKIVSGTSMSTPHISGIVATIKSKYPSWTPSMIRSAIMTTASQTNNLKQPMTTDSGSMATPHDYGAGEVSTTRALNPGLVYETTINDYLRFLCYHGYNESIIQTIANATAENFKCPKESSPELISDINYPSMSISNFTGKGSRSISRALTNVGSDGKVTYSAIVNSPNTLHVQLIPEKLQFSKKGEKLIYQVVFSSPSSFSSEDEDMFGSITWTDGKIQVKSPFVVSSRST